MENSNLNTMLCFVEQKLSMASLPKKRCGPNRLLGNPDHRVLLALLQDQIEQDCRVLRVQPYAPVGGGRSEPLDRVRAANPHLAHAPAFVRPMGGAYPAEWDGERKTC